MDANVLKIYKTLTSPHLEYHTKIKEKLSALNLMHYNLAVKQLTVGTLPEMKGLNYPFASIKH